MAVLKSKKSVVENSRGEEIMIEPSKIEEEFKKIEDENYALEHI